MRLSDLEMEGKGHVGTEVIRDVTKSGVNGVDTSRGVAAQCVMTSHVPPDDRGDNKPRHLLYCQFEELMSLKTSTPPVYRD